VILLGSQARGDSRPDRDVDLPVARPEGVYAAGFP
jgi:predicted nucleotidyltransferase